MNSSRALTVLLLISLMAGRLAAQCVLMAENNGKMSWVKAARDSDPCVEKDGKVQPILTQGFVLKDVPEYLPMFVSVRDVDVHSSSVVMSDGAKLNNMFNFTATLETAYGLTDVFIVLDITTESGEKSIFLNEIGTLEPNHAREVSAFARTSSPMGRGSYQMHIFAGGIEVLQSLIPFGKREAALDRMVAARVKDVQSQAPKLYLAASPEYPPSLKSANLRGQVTVAFRIGPNGAVYNPVVRSATDPAFGEAALAAVRIWRFLPQVKDGEPVGVDVVIPIVFEQPKPTKA
jgi:TonB family protein